MKFTLCKKQYIYLFLVGLSISLALVTHVRAEEGVTNTMPGMVRERVEERQAIREERRSQLSEALQNRVVNLASNVESRLRALGTRLTNIADRLESRIGKLRDEGVDTGNAEVRLEDVRNALTGADAMLNSMADDAANISAAESPRGAFRMLRAKFLAIHATLREAHAGLRETLALLKEAVRTASEGNGVSSAVQNENADGGQNKADETGTEE